MTPDGRDVHLRIEHRARAPLTRAQRAQMRPGPSGAARGPEPADDGTRTQWFRPMNVRNIPHDEQLRLAYDRTRLANERTFAAWLRTGLAVAAGGVALAHLVPESARSAPAGPMLGATFVLLGIAILVYGGRQFTRMSATLPRGSGASPPVAPRMIYLLTTCMSMLLLAALLFPWTNRGTVPRDAHGARGAGTEPRNMPSGAVRSEAGVR